MERQTENRLVLVTRRTRLEELIQRFNTAGQAKFYIEHLGADFASYQDEHDTYQQALTHCLTALSRLGKVSQLERAFLPNYLFRPDDTVVVLGQDGTVANTLKYLEGQPCIGVNPDPGRWDGVLLPFTPGDLTQLVPAVFGRRATLQPVTFAKATLNTGETLRAVNDLFIGPASHTSARYEIHHQGRSEHQSSSGLIVSTGLGSTGWLKSIRTGAAGISGTKNQSAHYPWDYPQLLFSVREPFPSRSSQADIITGTIQLREPLVMVSEMAASGVIFSDGVEKDFLPFNNGTRATITVLPKAGSLVVR